MLSGKLVASVFEIKVNFCSWHAIVVDGKDVNQLLAAFKEASETKTKPTCIIAKTFKGSGLKGIENELDWHGKPLGDKAAELVANLRKLVNEQTLVRPTPAKVTAKVPEYKKEKEIKLAPTNYDGKKEIATRLAHGTALEKLGKACEYAIALDGDTKNSTYSIKFRDAYPNRFVECYIAEQNMVQVAIGIATRQRYISFVHTFAAFLLRAADQIRMGAISFTQVKYVGSHAGVSIGEDGPSQMALEDFAFFRTIPNIVCFYPSDAVSAERAVELAANYNGAVYIRTSRPNFSILYKNDEVFQIGKAKVNKTKAFTPPKTKRNFIFLSKRLLLNRQTMFVQSLLVVLLYMKLLKHQKNSKVSAKPFVSLMLLQ